MGHRDGESSARSLRFRGHIVFPDIVVDQERQQQLRMSVIENLRGTKLESDLRTLDGANVVTSFIKEVDFKSRRREACPARGSS